MSKSCGNDIKFSLEQTRSDFPAAAESFSYQIRATGSERASFEDERNVARPLQISQLFRSPLPMSSTSSSASGSGSNLEEIKVRPPPCCSRPELMSFF